MPPESCVKILFVGDMHLGRLPSRVPEPVLDQGAMTLRDLGPAGAWDRIVAAAIEQKVHAVALAGDLVERDNAMFEAYGPLANGVRRLVEQGIIVTGVAGNHDTRVLPKLADEIKDFRLLGPGGTWSVLEISGDQGLAVNLAGWSFPSQHHRESPLRTPPPHPNGITLGLLHADLDQAGSDYAPVRSSDLKAIGYHGWFLGHVHIPGAVPAPFDGTPFYLGSVTGLDPNETGQRGPVLVSISGGGKIEAERLPLAPLRWEHRDLDCSDLADPVAEMEAHLLKGLINLFDENLTELDEVGALGIRFRLTGEVDDPAALEKIMRELDYSRLVTERQGTALFIQRVSANVTARIDLFVLAEQSDPPGLLARQILVLENSGQKVPEVADAAALTNELLAAARQALVPVDRDAAFIDLADQEDQISDEELRRMLIKAGRLALAGLLAQPADEKGAGHAAG